MARTFNDRLNERLQDEEFKKEWEMVQMECKYCKSRGKTWHGDDPKCAFRKKDGIFTSDNWNCAAMNLLRHIANNLGSYYRNDNIGSIGYVPFEGDDDAGFIVMTWYKDRGKTSDAFVVWEEKEDRRELTIEDVVAAVEYNKEYIRGYEG